MLISRAYVIKYKAKVVCFCKDILQNLKTSYLLAKLIL